MLLSVKKQICFSLWPDRRTKREEIQDRFREGAAVWALGAVEDSSENIIELTWNRNVLQGCVISALFTHCVVLLIIYITCPERQRY